MKIMITKIIGSFGDDSSVNKVHLNGAFDSTACGLAHEEYEFKKTNKKLSCTTCITILEWSKTVAKIKE